MQYLLDTNICIYISKHKPASVLAHFQTLSVGSVGMSVITYGELWYGIRKSTQFARSAKLLEALTALVPVLPFSANVAKFYGDVRAQLTAQGQPIGNNDLWIAAHALSEKLILVSNNLKEFSRVPGLHCENWVE